MWQGRANDKNGEIVPEANEVGKRWGAREVRGQSSTTITNNTPQTTDSVQSVKHTHLANTHSRTLPLMVKTGVGRQVQHRLRWVMRQRRTAYGLGRRSRADICPF